MFREMWLPAKPGYKLYSHVLAPLSFIFLLKKRHQKEVSLLSDLSA